MSPRRLVSAAGALAFPFVALSGACGDGATSTTTTSTTTTAATGTGGATSTSTASASSSSTSAATTATTTTTSSSTSSTGGAGGAPVVPACSVDVPRTVPLQAWAEPDADQAPFVDALATATTSIRVMVYEMGYGQILDTLKQKAMSGVDVRVILDVSQQSINQKYFDQLTAAGAQVEWSDPQFTYMHAKDLIIDGHIAIISTGNYLASQIAKERNYVVRDEDPADLAVLRALFDADFARTSPDLSCTRLVVSPVNARARLLDLINGATTTLDIESMQFADTQIRAAVVARHDAGVVVRVLLADPSWITANTAAAQYLADHGIAAKYLSDPMVHVKAIAADVGTSSARVYMGSENLSYTSLDKNRETGVIAYEPAILDLAATTFDQDWASATSF